MYIQHLSITFFFYKQVTVQSFFERIPVSRGNFFTESHRNKFQRWSLCARHSCLPVETRVLLHSCDSFPVRHQDDGLQREGLYPKIR